MQSDTAVLAACLTRCDGLQQLVGRRVGAGLSCNRRVARWLTLTVVQHICVTIKCVGHICCTVMQDRNDVFGDVDAQPDKTADDVTTCTKCDAEVHEDTTDVYGVCTMCRRGR